MSRMLSLVLGVLVVVGGLVGCEGYQLRGKVIRGDYSAIELVPKNDPRLAQAGLSGVSLHLQSDPNRLHRETVARGTSGPDGELRLPVDLVGAGFLMYDVGLFARKEGHAPAESMFRLPGSGKRVLITMAVGQDRDLGEERHDPYREYEEFR